MVALFWEKRRGDLERGGRELRFSHERESGRGFNLGGCKIKKKLREIKSKEIKNEG